MQKIQNRIMQGSMNMITSIQPYSFPPTINGMVEILAYYIREMLFRLFGRQLASWQFYSDLQMLKIQKVVQPKPYQPDCQSRPCHLLIQLLTRQFNTLHSTPPFTAATSNYQHSFYPCTIKKQYNFPNHLFDLTSHNQFLHTYPFT